MFTKLSKTAIAACTALFLFFNFQTVKAEPASFFYYSELEEGSISISENELYLECNKNESIEKEYSITNNSSSNVEIVQEYEGSDVFSINNESIVVKSGESAILSISFAPRKVGLFEGLIKVRESESAELIGTISLTGVSILKPAVLKITPNPFEKTLTVGENFVQNATVKNLTYSLTTYTAELTIYNKETSELVYTNSISSPVPPIFEVSYPFEMQTSNIPAGEYKGVATFTAEGKDEPNLVVPMMLHILPNCEATEYTKETSICEGDSLLFDGIYLKEQGEYTQIIPTGTECDTSIHLNLTVFDVDTTDIYIETCNDYTWHSETYGNSGIYSYTSTNENSCNSVEILHLEIKDVIETTDEQVACELYEWEGDIYTKSGKYTKTLESSTGCDSIVHLNVTINEPKETETYVEACGDYEWNDKIITQSGNYTTTLTAVNGCDSTVTLHLTITNIPETETEVNACDTYEWNGKIYEASGEFTEIFEATNGCDSIVNLNLTINDSYYNIDKIEECDSYEWEGEKLTKSDVYTKTYTSTAGCDSTVAINLTINKSYINDTAVEACFRYELNDDEITSSGIYQVAGKTTNGCDSIINYHVDIKSIQAEVIVEESKMTAKEENAEYKWMDCDNEMKIIDGETSQTLTVKETGNYAVSISKDGCEVTSECMYIEISTVGVDNSITNIHCKPNPTAGTLIISGTQMTSIEITTISGTSVLEKNAEGQSYFNIDITHLPAGFYYVNITTKNGTVSEKIIKE